MAALAPQPPPPIERLVAPLTSSPTSSKSASRTSTFESFRRDIEDRVLRFNARFIDPEATWPGVLFLDTPRGLEAEAFDLVGITADEKAELASRTLPELILTRGAWRVCWLMPAWRVVADGRQECLVMVFGECNRLQVVLTAVSRSVDRPPGLGHWEQSAVGLGVARGLFVDSLIEAVSSARAVRLANAESAGCAKGGTG
jgi:hypothetical protein